MYAKSRIVYRAVNAQRPQRSPFIMRPHLARPARPSPPRSCRMLPGARPAKKSERVTARSANLLTADSVLTTTIRLILGISPHPASMGSSLHLYSQALQLASAVLGIKFWLDTPLFTTLHYAPPAKLLTDRVALVTGGNAGLGLETAVHLARLEPKLLILAVRDVVRGEKARRVVAERSGLPVERIEVWELDMANFDRQVLRPVFRPVQVCDI